ncbi:MAG: FMN-binding protein [Firmicutes bacterium]|nr:FMN-binding protein [Bacillota bacterium]
MKNKSDISVMLKEAGILFCITLIAGLLLGFVYELTKEPRRIQQEKAVQEACIAVFPKAAEQGIELQFEDTGYVPDEALAAELAENNVKIGKVFAAYNNGALYGYVVESVSTKGYGGSIVLYVGVGTDKTVNGVSITEISETAGLGMEAPNVLTPQFAGKKVESFVFTKTGAAAENEVDAISGATITTRAVTNAANGGLKVALILLGGGAVNE